jgi:hypothetical protein
MAVLRIDFGSPLGIASPRPQNDAVLRTAARSEGSEMDKWLTLVQAGQQVPDSGEKVAKSSEEVAAAAVKITNVGGSG